MDQMNRELSSVVEGAKRKLGADLLILAHHYQRDEIVDWAHFRGDSLELAKRAAGSAARYIVFCGVHFMAETAAILARPGQKVFIPREDAGCFLAHQADSVQLRDAWDRLALAMAVDRELLPVAYVNTTAEVKAFVGEKEGACCTSSSADAVLSWALDRRPRVMFLPDQHLGQNTGRRLGLPAGEIALWDPRRPQDDLAFLRKARLLVWGGACTVHVRFLPEDVQRVRAERPGIKVIVHPECRPEVVTLADEVGSTSFIIQKVSSSPPGTAWAVGTEQRLVARLAKENPGQTVFSLADPPPYCTYMSLTRLSDLADLLSRLLSGDEPDPLEVREGIAVPARAALLRMMEIVG